MNSEDREGERERETFSLRTAQGLSCSLENFDLLCERGPTQLPPFSTHVVQLYSSQCFKVCLHCQITVFVQQLQTSLRIVITEVRAISFSAVVI